jgi:hypothetical protein
VVSEFLKNVGGLITDLNKMLADKKIDENVVQRLTSEINKGVEEVANRVLPLISSVKRSEEELKTCELQVRNLEGVIKEKEKKAIESDEQTGITSLIGCMLGTMVWKSSQDEKVINTFIDKEMIEEFILLASAIMKVFVATFAEQLPSTETNEFKFAMSIQGVIVNISAQERGRSFMLRNENGIKFIKQTLKDCVLLPMPGGQLLKRMYLIVLHNFSISKSGASIINQCDYGVKNILTCLSPENTTEIQQLALTIAKSLLDEIPSKELSQNFNIWFVNLFIYQQTKVYLFMNLQVSHEHLQLLMSSDDEGLRQACKEFCFRIDEILDSNWS